MPVPDRAATSTARTFAWVGAGVFVLSLSYFLYSYWIVFGRVVDGQPDAFAILWNAGLFSAFALHHSVFAREPIRRRLAVTFPHLERSIYVWVASLLFIVVCWQWRPVGGVLWDLNGWARLAVTAIHAGGILLSVYSAALIDAFELAGVRHVNSRRPTPNSQPLPIPNSKDTLPTLNSQGTPPTPNSQGTPPTPNSQGTPPTPNSQGTLPTPDSQHVAAPNAQSEEFKTTGPYGWVRHPIYLGWFVLVFAVSTMTMTRLVFAVVSCAYILVAMPFEERSIRASSGGAYDRYMTRVPRKLIPGVY